MLYSPGSSARIAQPLVAVVSVFAVAAGAGPVAVTVMPATPSLAAFVTCTISALPGGGLMMPLSATGLRTPSEAQVTVEVVRR